MQNFEHIQDDGSVAVLYREIMDNLTVICALTADQPEINQELKKIIDAIGQSELTNL